MSQYWTHIAAILAVALVSVLGVGYRLVNAWVVRMEEDSQGRHALRNEAGILTLRVTRLESDLAEVKVEVRKQLEEMHSALMAIKEALAEIRYEIRLINSRAAESAKQAEGGS